MLRKTLLNLSLALAAALLALLVFDRALLLLNVPSEPLLRNAHPPHAREHRVNLEYTYDFETNNQGLRYPDLPVVKPAGTYRVFVAGDSYTEGFGVETEARYTNLLERHFASQQTRFINGGLAGTGPLQYGRALLHTGLPYNLDGVLLAIYANDLVGTPPSATAADLFATSVRFTGAKRLLHSLWPRTLTLLKQLQDQGEHRARTRPSDLVRTVTRQAAQRGIPASDIAAWRSRLPDSLVTAIQQGTFNGSAFTYGLLYPDYWIDALDIASDRAQQQWLALQGLLLTLIGASRREGLEVGVVFIPTRFQYDPRSHVSENPWIQAGCRVRRAWLTEDTALQRRLAAWARATHVPMLDLTEAFRAAAHAPQRLNYPLDGHWTPEGHHQAAKTIAAWLVKANVFSFLRAEEEEALP